MRSTTAERGAVVVEVGGERSGGADVRPHGVGGSGRDPA